MASQPRLFIRVLQAIIHKLWTVLFFLTMFSLITVLDHWWGTLASGYAVLRQLVMNALGTAL